MTALPRARVHLRRDTGFHADLSARPMRTSRARAVRVGVARRCTGWSLALEFIDASSYVWRFKHDVQHHSYAKEHLPAAPIAGAGSA